MSKEEAVFIHILRNVLWGDNSPAPDLSYATANIDWKQVLRIAHKQSCLHAINVWMLKNHIPSPYTQHYKANIFLTLQRQARLNQLAAEVIELLREHGIAAVLLKGYPLALLYPDPDMRAYGDVDIYVGEHNYVRAAEIVTAAYPRHYDHSDINNNWVHYVLYLDDHEDQVIELHRTTTRLKRNSGDPVWQQYTEQCLQEPHTPSVPICGTDIPVPPANYNMLYLFMHVWHHFEETNGVGFRQIADWTLAIHHAYLQTDTQQWQQQVSEIKRILDALALTSVWQLFGHIAVDVLHLPEEEFPLYTRAHKLRGNRLLRQLLRDGHWQRPTAFNLKEIALMRPFHGTRPKHIRPLQVLYTFYRLTFEALQRAKLFPRYAWAWYRTALHAAVTKHRN